MGDAEAGPVRLSFNPQLRVEFRGATVTSDAELLLPASWTSASTDTRSGSSRPGAPDPACPVLHPPACRELLDTAPRQANSRAHRAPRMAPHVIEAGHGGGESEALLRGASPARIGARANPRTMGRLPRGCRGNGPCDAFRAAERARGSSRGSFSNARERGFGSKSQIPRLNPRATAVLRVRVSWRRICVH